MPLRLILVFKNQEKILEIDKEEVTLGRASDNDIEIEDINSSRYHCQIKNNSQGNFFIVDLKSRNGTFVNGVLVDKKILQSGDKIEIGQSTFFYDRRKNFEGEETARLPILDFSEEEIIKRDKAADQSPEDLEQQVQDLYQLLDINRALTSETNSKKLLELIMDSSIEVSDAERGFLILREGEALEMKCSRNLDGEFVKKSKFKISTSIVQEVLKTGQTVLTNDAQNDDRFTGIFSVHGLKLRSVLCVPLRIKNENVGVLYLDNRFEQGVFNRQDLYLIQAFADQAAIALKMVSLLEEKKTREKELEEAKIRALDLNQQLEKELEKQKLRLEAIESKARKEKKGTSSKKTPKFKFDYSNIITQSPRMYEIFKILDKVVDSNVPVLIQGESGTGKELIARALHFNSRRQKKPFVSENCGAIPQNLMESEFFGYEKGAFTGADKRKLGLFEVASGSTLFMDEISEMSPDIQTKLLRVLQEGEIRRVGGKETIKVDVRIISACNRDLSEEVRKNRFREDLFYRLNVITLELPPLRDRKEDIPDLIDFFLDRANKKIRRAPKTISDDSVELLLSYNWPGNIRELENEIERAVALSKEMITPEYFSESIFNGSSSAPTSSSFSTPSRGTLKEILQDEGKKIERRVILDVLVEVDWKKSDAAQRLGISRPTLDSKIEKYSIKRET